MTASYEQGLTDGTEAARRDLVDHQRIAAGFARARLDLIASGPVPIDDYRRAWLAAYRSVLEGFLR